MAEIETRLQPDRDATTEDATIPRTPVLSEATLDYLAGTSRRFDSVAPGRKGESDPLGSHAAGGEQQLPVDPLLGQRVGVYRIVDVVGAGGMGCVYRAEQHEPVRRDVAIKVLGSDMAGGDAVASFRREQQTLAELHHPGIAGLLDAGTLPATDGRLPRPYFVMELVAGQPLDQFCDDRSLDWKQRVLLVAHVAEIVGFAHRRGVLHRDLKPSNILASEVDGRIHLKLIDFGIATAIEPTPQFGDSLSCSVGDPTSGNIAASSLRAKHPGSPDESTAIETLYCDTLRTGTPRYASPEQMLGRRDIDGRADVFSLGTVLYKLLAGRTPLDWPATQPPELPDYLAELCRTPPPPLGRTAQATGVGKLPRDIEVCTHAALAKLPQHRYASADDFASDLRAVASGQPPAIRSRGTASLASSVLRARFVRMITAGTLTLLVACGVTMARSQSATSPLASPFDAASLSDGAVWIELERFDAARFALQNDAAWETGEVSSDAIDLTVPEGSCRWVELAVSSGRLEAFASTLPEDAALRRRIEANLDWWRDTTAERDNSDTSPIDF